MFMASFSQEQAQLTHVSSCVCNPNRILNKVKLTPYELLKDALDVVVYIFSSRAATEDFKI
jgi:hypothetical protein